MMRRGFTIVELIITITIMAILLTLAVVNLNASQANARDAERQSDVDALALGFENYYTNVDTNVSGSGGAYPPTTYILADTYRQYLPDIDAKVFTTPTAPDKDTFSVAAATTTSRSVAAIQPMPSAMNDIYVYQPLTVSNTLCTSPSSGECRKFNLYYYLESDGLVHVITSRHQ